MPLLIKLYQNPVLIPASRKKSKISLDKEFEVVYANAKNIDQIIKSLNINKTRGPDGTSAKFAKNLGQ